MPLVASGAALGANALRPKAAPVLTVVSTAGQAISDSDFSGFPKGEAFDTTTSNAWATNLTGTGISGNAYIGQDFGASAAYEIIEIDMRQAWTGGADTTYGVNSIKVQYSDNGSAWSDANTITPTLNGTSPSSLQTFSVTPSGAHRYWRLLANQNLGGGVHWVVCVLQMKAYV